MKADILYRQLIAIIFIAAFLAQTFNKSLVRADYYADTSKYAKNCVNKAKPTMHCNGKCQLMKKLQQEEKKDQENPERKGEYKAELTLSSKSFFSIVNEIPALAMIRSTFPPITDAYSYNGNGSIFHPPKV